MTDPAYVLCSGCRERLDPSAPSVVYAVQLLRIDTMRGTVHEEGLGHYFHTGCFPAGAGFRQKPKP